MISTIAGFAYDCRDSNALADFYARLLGWEKVLSGEGWAGLQSPQSWILAFQDVEEYEPPVWPWKKGQQQQQAHMDFYVDNLEDGVAHALACGAVKADTQYFETSVTMLDPEGHPFCLSAMQQ